MRAKDAKNIPISSYLSREGFEPAKTRLWGRELWYCSPLRAGDSSPSFKVDTELNLWFDHGFAVWGDVINLVCELHQTSTKNALAILESSGLKAGQSRPINLRLTQNWLFWSSEPQKKFAGEKEKSQGYFALTHEWELQSPALVEYLLARKIDIDIARKYLKEIRFKPRNLLRDYFAVGWPNGDGYEARSKLFKGFVGTTKDISRINLTDWNSLSIFEGFFDYLAFLSHYNISEFQNSAIILNSTSLRKRALAEIEKYTFSKVYLFLDNDVAGNDCKQFFKLWIDGVKVVDKSYIYEACRDLNEWTVRAEN